MAHSAGFRKRFVPKKERNRMNVPTKGQTMGHKATATDVARAAGVSKWTVSRAFKKDASVADGSRARILEAASQLGYRPNLLARSLSKKSTQQIAVLVDDFRNPHKLPALDLLTAALQRKGLVAVLININEQNTHVDAILNADQRQVDAVILLGTSFRDETLNEHALHPGSPPLYVLARESTVDQVTAVSCDAAVSMEELGRHLLDRGYRRPGFMSGPKTLSTVLRRMHHFAAFWERHGVQNVPELAAGAYDRTAAEQAMSRYLSTAAGERIDVLMCENDALAFGAMDAARFGFGLKVPTELAFAGYDGNELTASPSYDLTTYEQPWSAMVDRLLGMIVGDVELASVNIPGRLIIRGST
jgi:DNA-binding LacI/PurR family transcriptional regulator